MLGLLAEVLAPAGPVFTPALAGLFIIAACIVAIGMCKLVDAISRSFFGTLGGAVGWIPFAGRVVKHSLHSIEQKISHGLGAAERKLDALVAASWHNLARLVHYMAREIEGAAVTAWHLAQQAHAFVRRREMSHEIKAAVKPVRAQAIAAERVGRLARAEARAVEQAVAQGVYPRIRAGEAYDRAVAMPSIRSARAEARIAEEAAIRAYKWLIKRKHAYLTGAFVGAAAWALTRLGGGWIRCANWRKIGKRVCRMPTTLIDALLGIALATELVIDPEEVANVALGVVDTFEGIIERIAE